jgi:hypothetical protein
MPKATPRASTMINIAMGRRLRSGAALCLSVVAMIINARIAVPINSEAIKARGDRYSAYIEFQRSRRVRQIRICRITTHWERRKKPSRRYRTFAVFVDVDGLQVLRICKSCPDKATYDLSQDVDWKHELKKCLSRKSQKQADLALYAMGTSSG